jgi:hypothetical protein
MIHFKKAYEMPKSKDEYKNIDITVHYGLDEDLINNHPQQFKEDNIEILFLFVNIKDGQWFDVNFCNNPNIEVFKINIDEDKVSKEMLERFVDEMMNTQIQALTQHFISVDQQENDLS